jgi:small subunit ribosomal protein S7
MSRRAQAPRRDSLPDPKFGNAMLAKFINMVMKSGKKSVAEKIVYNAIERMSERVGKDQGRAIELLGQALDNIKPAVEVKSRRVGGATYQVPVEVRPERATSLAMRWIITSARTREGKSMRDKLANELIDAANERGEAVKKKEDTHRMADANKAFSHYRW